MTIAIKLLPIKTDPRLRPDQVLLQAGERPEQQVLVENIGGKMLDDQQRPETGRIGGKMEKEQERLAGSSLPKERRYEPLHQGEIERRFTYHPKSMEQAFGYKAIRDEARAFAVTLLTLTPPGREQALALTKLQEAVMWANAALETGDE